MTIPAGAAELSVLTSNSSFPVLAALAPAFGRATGQRYLAQVDTARKQMKPRTVTREGGYIGGVVAAGEAEIAIQQIVELLAVPGIDVVGPLPDEIQKVFETAAGIFRTSAQPAAADALLRFLLAPASSGVFRERGLESAM